MREESCPHAHDLYRLGYDICGFVSEDERTPVKADRNQVLGTVEDIKGIGEKKKILKRNGVAVREKEENNVTDTNRTQTDLKIESFLVSVALVLFPFPSSPLWRRGEEGLSSGVFSRQERIGYLGQPFWMYKFRTMYVNAEENGPSLSSEDDLRVTPFRTYHAEIPVGRIAAVLERAERGYVAGRTAPPNGNILSTRS